MSSPVDISSLGLGEKYEFVEELRLGGMGAVYKVRHRKLGVYHVIKVIRPKHRGNKELLARFLSEARAAANLDHHNVVRIHDLRIVGDQCRIDMEYIDGVDLSRLIDPDHLLSLPLVLEISRQCLRALGYLHKNGIVHRDVSPDNFMLSLDADGRPLVKLIDLGLAKHPEGKGTKMFLGKLHYASPEHFGPSEEIEQRSDLYAFGIVLYELLTGQHPLFDETTTFAQAMHAHLSSRPIPFSVSDPHDRVPERLRQLVLTALEKDPLKRFASADELAEKLGRLQEKLPLTKRDLRDLGERLANPKPVGVSTEKRTTETFPGVEPSGPEFVVGSAIERDEDFFGRVAQRDELRHALRLGQPVQILGERRMGKTSLLKWVQRHISEWQGHPVAWVNAQGLAGQSPRDFVRGIAEALGRKDEVERILGEELPARVLEKLLPLALLVDEASDLAQPGHGFDSSFLGALRVFGQDRKLLWISASIRELRECFQETHLTSNFLNDARQIWVGQIERSAAEGILARLNDPESTQLALRQAGGFAYGLQWLGYKLQRDRSNPEAICFDFFEDMKPNFRRWWSAREEGEQGLLKRSISGLARDRLTGRDRRDAWRLERLGLLADQDGQLTLPGAAWQEFVQDA